MILQEKGSFVSFKTMADKDRNYRLAHQNYNKQKNPNGHVCLFKVEGVPFVYTFDSGWFLKNNKNQSDHIVKRKRGGKPLSLSL